MQILSFILLFLSSVFLAITFYQVKQEQKLLRLRSQVYNNYQYYPKKVTSIYDWSKETC
jgi:hypothetical protein